MHVPDLTGLTNATDLLNAIEASTQGDSNDTEQDAGSTSGRKPKAFGRPAAVLNPSDGTARSAPAKKEEQAGQLHNRQTSCPSGQAFYRCSTGFTGCCSTDPCGAGQTCPDGQSSSAAATETTSLQTAGAATAQVSETPSLPRLASVHRADRQSTTMTGASLMTASSSMSSSMASPSSDVGTPGGPVPICPIGNGTYYTDNSNVEYMVHCNMDNTFPSENTVSVGTGGYGECFSACSRTKKCAGFTFIGVDSGDCYLKNKVPANMYVNKGGSNYVTCMKGTAASMSSMSGSAMSSSTTHKSSVGTIIGGVIGGIGGLILLLVLVALCAKRRRAQIEERRGGITVTQVISSPIETQQLPIAHQRQRSTSHDVYSPYGGFYHGTSNANSDFAGNARFGGLEGLEHHVGPPPPVPSSLPAEDSQYTLPPTVYQRPPRF